METKEKSKTITLKHTDRKTGEVTETAYMMVKDRITDFRKDHPEWPLITHLEKMEGGNVVFSCKVKNDKGEIIATGWAWETVSSGYINKYSAVENCETSAIGRALANLGYGTDGAYASYEEMQKAVDDETKDILFELLRTSTFDDEQKVFYEKQIKECTISEVSDLFDLMTNNQLEPMEGGHIKQKDIQLKLDKTMKDDSK